MAADPADVIIVGAGIAGLMAARRLSGAGFRVVVVDENAVAGGRLATARLGGGRADSGAQFFTVRTPEFGAEVGRWLALGLVYEWSRGWTDGSLLNMPPDGYPRYAATGGFAALAAALADGIDVRYSTRLTSLAHPDGHWLAAGAWGKTWQSRAVILTPPAPRSLALLAGSKVTLPEEARRSLEAIPYAPCLCGLVSVDGDVNLPEPGALQRPSEPISWIADNHRKGISPNARVLTIHANAEASVRYWAMTDEAILGWMLAEIRPWLAEGARVVSSRLERWRYAAPLSIYPARCLVADSPGPVAFAGDAFDGPRVEGAALSGWAAAGALTDYLKLRY